MGEWAKGPFSAYEFARLTRGARRSIAKGDIYAGLTQDRSVDKFVRVR
jgi:hypothetical protein